MTTATPDLIVALELEDGTTEAIPVVLDFSDITPDQIAQIHRIAKEHIPMELEPSPEFVAACIFAKLNRPDTDWPALKDLLAGVATGTSDITLIER